MKLSNFLLSLILLLVCGTVYAGDEVHFATQEDEKAFDSLLQQQSGNTQANKPAPSAKNAGDKKFLQNEVDRVSGHGANGQALPTRKAQGNGQGSFEGPGGPNGPGGPGGPPPNGGVGFPPPPRPNGVPPGTAGNPAPPPPMNGGGPPPH